MIRLELGVEDLADTRFGISPLTETVFSLWALTDPSRHTLHLPWIRAARGQLDEADARLLFSLVGRSRSRPDFRGSPSRALPDFLTPRPERFVARFEDELAAVRASAPGIVRRDLRATHAPDPLPDPLRAVARSNDRAALKLLGAICDALERHWERSLAPTWSQMQLVLEADTTYRARQLATGGARLLFADMHPNLRWSGGVLTIHEMISEGTIAAAGRGLLLVPSIFAYKPVPPLDPTEPPAVGYPSRGVGTLWAPAAALDDGAIVDLLGRPRARVLEMLGEPLPTLELARRLEVTPSAVSQHLKVLRANGLLTSARDRRHVLYRRTALGDQLIAGSP
ncbi:MAG TPA: helix-turn-helix domain-containing protein [Solirubrobacteraceae bacterium]|nr:helix-turn-helix domain-containing protein [Solirubrobacteraceae bacterium]